MKRIILQQQDNISLHGNMNVHYCFKRGVAAAQIRALCLTTVRVICMCVCMEETRGRIPCVPHHVPRSQLMHVCVPVSLFWHPLPSQQHDSTEKQQQQRHSIHSE